MVALLSNVCDLFMMDLESLNFNDLCWIYAINYIPNFQDYIKNAYTLYSKHKDVGN
jgi:hypothetical protein